MFSLHLQIVSQSMQRPTTRTRIQLAASVSISKLEFCGISIHFLTANLLGLENILPHPARVLLDYVLQTLFLGTVQLHAV